MVSEVGSPGRSRWGRVAREALPLLVLIAASTKATYDEWRLRDLTLTDESFYLSLALKSADGGVSRFLEVGPLYLLWYRVLLCAPVGIEYLSFVSHGLLLALLSGLFYALARRLMRVVRDRAWRSK